jgi:hypothetical protein
MVDATFVPAPKQHISKDDSAKVEDSQHFKGLINRNNTSSELFACRQRQRQGGTQWPKPEQLWGTCLQENWIWRNRYLDLRVIKWKKPSK